MKYRVYYDERPMLNRGDVIRLGLTHIYVRTVEADSLGEVFTQMQGEVWSPNGEARMLIEYLGLSHTSMSVGDLAVDEYGVVYRCASRGWEQIMPDTAFCREFREREDPTISFGAWLANRPVSEDRWSQIGAVVAFIEQLLATGEFDYEIVPDFLRVGEGFEFTMDAIYGAFLHRVAKPGVTHVYW